jgi:outer membrane protein assembly factor BamB
MIAIGFSGCTPSIVWNPGTAFAAGSFLSGVSRSAPTVTSGGVVFVMAPINSSGTGGLFALDASSGALLNGGNPIFTANSSARMGPIVDGDWVWVSDSGGDLYGFTTDPSVPALVQQSTVRHSVPLERDRQ